MRQDRTLAPEYYPRGAIVSTGEDIPTGHSLRGRLLILSVQPEDINLEELSTAQEHAKNGVYAELMAVYI
jgi:hypothetical protein